MRNLIISVFLLLTYINAISQNVGIGTTLPEEKLDITGHIKMTGEIKPNGVAGQAGQVLSTNGNGAMQWATATTSTMGNDGWGDCSILNIDSYQRVANADAQTGDKMGRSVAISGDYAIVGAYLDDEGGLIDNGSVTFFKRNTTTNLWEAQVKFINLAPESGDNFGVSVSISGDYAIVGADLDNEGGFEDSGSATIFKRNTNTGIWERQIKVSNIPSNSGARFGVSVSISGEYAIIGAPLDNTFGPSLGSVTILKRNNVTGEWLNWDKLMNLGAAANDYFGYSVSISGDYVIAGAYLDDEGGQIDNGSATIFKRNTGTGGWEIYDKLTNPIAGSFDCFGYSVAISGDFVIVGSPFDDEGGFNETGSVTIFKRNPGTGLWQNQGKLVNPSSAHGDSFGWSVAISGDYAIIGTSRDDENSDIDNGSITIFKRYENTWFGYQKFSYPISSSKSFFGTAVSLDGSTNRFVVGAEGVFTNMGAAFFGRIK